MAIGEWADYKVIVTRGRVKKFAKTAWQCTVLTPIPPDVMKIAGVEYKYILLIDIACVLRGTVCLVLIGYLYVRVYFCVRKQETEKNKNKNKNKQKKQKCRFSGQSQAHHESCQNDSILSVVVYPVIRAMIDELDLPSRWTTFKGSTSCQDQDQKPWQP